MKVSLRSILTPGEFAIYYNVAVIIVEKIYDQYIESHGLRYGIEYSRPGTFLDYIEYRLNKRSFKEMDIVSRLAYYYSLCDKLSREDVYRILCYNNLKKHYQKIIDKAYDDYCNRIP